MKSNCGSSNELNFILQTNVWMDVMLTGQSSLGQIPWSWCIGLLESQSNQTHHTKPLNSGSDVVTTSRFAGRMGLNIITANIKLIWKWNCSQLLRMKILCKIELIGPIQLVFLNGNTSRIRFVYWLISNLWSSYHIKNHLYHEEYIFFFS